MAKKKYIAPSELLGNYYPGKAVPRGFTYDPKGAVEFQDVGAIYDDIYKEIYSGVEALPKEVKSKIRNKMLGLIPDDVSMGFEVAETYTPPTQEGEAPKETQTVKFKMNVNPVDWAKDPGKMAQNLANTLVKQTFGIDIKKGSIDLSPIEKKIMREQFLVPLVSGGLIGADASGAQGPMEKALHSLFEDKAEVAAGRKGLGITDTSAIDYTRNAKSYQVGRGEVLTPGSSAKSLQKNFVTYMEGIGSTRERDKVFNNFVDSLLNHIDTQAAHNASLDFGEGSDILNGQRITSTFGTTSRIFDTHGNDALSFSIRSLNEAHTDRKSLVEAIAGEKNDKARSKLEDRLHVLDKRIDSTALDAQRIASDVLHHVNSAMPTGGVTPVHLEAMRTAADQIVNASGSDFRNSDFGKNIESSLSSARDALKKAVSPTSTTIGSLHIRDNRESLKNLGELSGNIAKKAGSLSKAKLKEANKIGPNGILNDPNYFNAELKSIKDSVDGQIKKLQTLKVSYEKEGKGGTQRFTQIHGQSEKALADLRAELEGLSTIHKMDDLNKFHAIIKKYDPKINKAYTTSNDKLTTELLFGKSAMAQEAQKLPEINAARTIWQMSRAQYTSKLASDVNAIIDKGPMAFIVSPLKTGTIAYLDKGLEYLGFNLNINDEIAKTFGRMGFVYDPDGLTGIIKKNILEPTHYFGLNYVDTFDPEKIQNYKVAKFFYDNVGEKILSKYRNKFSILVSGDSLTLNGGKHLEAFTSLGKLIASGKLTNEMLEALLNSDGKLANLEKIPGFEPLFDGETAESIQKLLNNLHSFKHWLLNNAEGRKVASFLGLGFSEGKGAKVFSIETLEGLSSRFKDEVMDASKFNVHINNKFLDFTKALAKAAGEGNKIAVAFLGSFQKISATLAKLKSQYNALLEKIASPLLKNIISIRQVLSKAISSAITAVFGATTGGLGIVLEVAIALVVDKLVTWTQKFFKGILKLDMSELFEDVTKYFEKIAKWVLVFFVAPMIIVFMSVDHSSSTVLSSISPVDNSRTDGVLLKDCGPIDERAQGAGSCGICDASDTVDWSPYTNGKAAFTDGIAFVLNAAAKDFNIPAGALAAIFYSEGWSENVPGKFDEEWTKDNVCLWSLDEGPLLPGCEERTSVSDARGSFGQIPYYFEQHIPRVSQKTPLPRTNYDPCNFLDAAYATASRFSEMSAAIGLSGCSSDWLSPMSAQPSGYADGLPAGSPKIQWAILHYACGAGPGRTECFAENFLDYSRKGLAVFKALSCF